MIVKTLPDYESRAAGGGLGVRLGYNVNSGQKLESK